MASGPQLELYTELAIEPGSTQFKISDMIINQGAQEQEFQMLYHCNFGLPFLGDGAQFVGPVETLKPFNARAAEGLDAFTSYAGPTTGFIEQVFLMTLFADDDKQTSVVLHNKAASEGVSMSWSVEELPYFTLWKNLAAEEDGYVTGLEPGTNYPNLRSIERDAGRVPELGGGERKTMSVTVNLLGNVDAVAVALERVEQIRGDRETKVQTTAE